MSTVQRSPSSENGSGYYSHSPYSVAARYPQVSSAKMGSGVRGYSGGSTHESRVVSTNQPTTHGGASFMRKPVTVNEEHCVREDRLQHRSANSQNAPTGLSTSFSGNVCEFEAFDSSNSANPDPRRRGSSSAGNFSTPINPAWTPVNAHDESATGRFVGHPRSPITHESQTGVQRDVENFRGDSQTLSPMHLPFPFPASGMSRGRGNARQSAKSVSSADSSRISPKQRKSNEPTPFHGTLLAVDTRTGRGGSMSGSSAGSVPENLPLCPDDANCTLINDKAHQQHFSHTCRLFPCYHGHIKRHAKLFRHAEGQIAASNVSGDKSKLMALASVNFAAISPDAPNATRVTVGSGGTMYDIFGDWSQVKVHTFKRYLHQVFGIEPRHQRLSLARGQDELFFMDDDLDVVSSYLARGGASTYISVVDSSVDAGEKERRKLREALLSEL